MIARIGHLMSKMRRSIDFPGSNAILQENGSFLLQENGSLIILE